MNGGEHRVYKKDHFCFVIGIINLEFYDAVVGILFNKKVLGDVETVKLCDSSVEKGRPILIVDTKENYRLVTFHGANPSGLVLQTRLKEKLKEKKCIFYIKEEAEAEEKAEEEKAGICVTQKKVDEEKIKIIAKEANAILDDIANDLHDKILKDNEGKKLVIMSDTNDMHYEPFGGEKYKERKEWGDAQNWSELKGICERLKDAVKIKSLDLKLPQFEENTQHTAPCCYNYNSIKGNGGKILNFLLFKPNSGVLDEGKEDHLKGEYGFYSDVILHHGFKTEPKMELLMEDTEKNDKLSDHRFIKLTLNSEDSAESTGKTTEGKNTPESKRGGRKKKKEN